MDASRDRSALTVISPRDRHRGRLDKPAAVFIPLAERRARWSGLLGMECLQDVLARLNDAVGGLWDLDPDAGKV
jgi:hypothetical protein